MQERNVIIDFSTFQNDPQEYEFLRKILKIVDKYAGIGIAEMVSRYKKDKLIRDQINLSALNVFLAVYAGKAEGEQNKIYGIRKTKSAAFFMNAKTEGVDGVDKVTDSICTNEAERRSKKLRAEEAKGIEKVSIYTNVMHRTNKLLDALENAIRSLDSEYRRTK